MHLSGGNFWFPILIKKTKTQHIPKVVCIDWLISSVEIIQSWAHTWKKVVVISVSNKRIDCLHVI